MSLIEQKTPGVGVLDGRYVQVVGGTMTGELIVDRADFQVNALSTRITGDTTVRATIDNWGIIKFSGGSGAQDTNLYRYIANVLKTDDSINVGGGVISFETGAPPVFGGFQLFNNGTLRHTFQIYTGNNDFFLDSYNDGGTIVNMMSANAQDLEYLFFKNGEAGKVGVRTAAPTEALGVNGNIALETAGNGLEIKEGTNARMGTVALASGIGTVSTTTITATSRVMLTAQDGTVNAGAVWVSGRTAGTSFVISSTDGADARTVAWVILEPA